MFLKATNNHKRANILYDPSHFVLQQLDYITYIDHYHEFIKAFHVKDSEFKPNGKKGAFGGYGTWKDRAGRYRSPGDGQIDFKTIFTKLTEYGCDVWAVMEWECCVKSPEQGAKEGAKFIQNQAKSGWLQIMQSILIRLAIHLNCEADLENCVLCVNQPPQHLPLLLTTEMSWW